MSYVFTWTNTRQSCCTVCTTLGCNCHTAKTITNLPATRLHFLARPTAFLLDAPLGWPPCLVVDDVVEKVEVVRFAVSSPRPEPTQESRPCRGRRPSRFFHDRNFVFTWSRRLVRSRLRHGVCADSRRRRRRRRDVIEHVTAIRWRGGGARPGRRCCCRCGCNTTWNWFMQLWQRTCRSRNVGFISPRRHCRSIDTGGWWRHQYAWSYDVIAVCGVAARTVVCGTDVRRELCQQQSTQYTQQFALCTVDVTGIGVCNAGGSDRDQKRNVIRHVPQRNFLVASKVRIRRNVDVVVRQRNCVPMTWCCGWRHFVSRCPWRHDWRASGRSWPTRNFLRHFCNGYTIQCTIKAWFWQAKHVCGSVQSGSVRFTLVAYALKITFGSYWFNMASVDMINFENKYDYPDNYELQQHRRSSVAVEWYKKCTTTASSTVLL